MGWTSAVAAIAVNHGVYKVTAESDQVLVYFLKGERDGVDGQAASDSGLFSVVIALVIKGSNTPRTVHHA